MLPRALAHLARQRAHRRLLLQVGAWASRVQRRVACGEEALSPTAALRLAEPRGAGALHGISAAEPCEDHRRRAGVCPARTRWGGLGPWAPPW
jgi:hypothetical protein